jgi:hypothetical protein
MKNLIPYLILLAILLYSAFGSASNLNSASAIAFIRVPQDTDLQTAIYQIGNGGVIEIAHGTYSSPPGGFVISDLGKSFTIQAAAGATVILDGGGSREILTYINSDPSRGGMVTFRGLTFANGKATTDGRAGGATLQRAQARFIQCTFRDNQGVQPNTGGGGVLVALGSRVTFQNTAWQSNMAINEGGGLAVNTQSEVFIYDSLFINNKVNISGHRQTSAGGAVHVGNSSLYVYRSHFEGNEAGYVGGAIFSIGNWGNQSNVVVVNSTFVRNKVAPLYSLPWPTEGGAFHAEDQTTAIVQDSRFADNEAMTGGALNLYRAVVSVSRTVFQNNKATGVGPANGFGGAISAISNDTPSDSENYRAAQLSLVDSVITSTLLSAGQSGGGIYIAGDTNRAYGLNGVTQQGSLANNRARATLERVIVFNNSVQEVAGVPGTGVGAGVFADLADITVKDSMIIANKAVGTDNSSGGGLAIINNSHAYLEGVTIAHNSVGKFGGGLFIQGSTIQAQNCALFGNVVDNGIYGSAIFSAPDEARNIDVSGSVSNCTIVGNVGLSIFDDDRSNGPINDLRYNSNQMRPELNFYRNSIAGVYSVSGLNSITIVRSSRNTKKSQLPNAVRPALPIGALLAVPPYSQPTSRYLLGYGWNGSSARLNGVSLSTRTGIAEVSRTGVHTLTVTGSGTPLTYTYEIRDLSRLIYLPVIKRR